MPRHDSAVQASANYDRFATLYTELCRDELQTLPENRVTLDAFAELVRDSTDRTPLIADLGCGPGHIAAYLRAAGFRTVGADCSHQIMVAGRAANGPVDSTQADLTALPFGTASVDAALARYSLIHVPPALLETVVSEISRIVAPNGCVLAQFHAAATAEHDGEEFDHKVTAAFRHDPDSLTRRFTDAGFTLVSTDRRPPNTASMERFDQASLVLRRTESPH